MLGRVENIVGKGENAVYQHSHNVFKRLLFQGRQKSGLFGKGLSGIHSSSVLKILCERLGLRKICARWVSHLLTDEQKQSRVRLASQIIEKYDKCDPCRLEEIVTFSSEGNRPVIARRCKTSNCMLYAIFFDSKGPVLQIPVQKGRSVTGKFYRESVLTQLVDFYQKRRPCTSVRGIKLLHDNASAHKSAMVQEYLKESGLDVLDHPPYSPDLSPCDFWLFPRLKKIMAGHHFELDESKIHIQSNLYVTYEGHYLSS